MAKKGPDTFSAPLTPSFFSARSGQDPAGGCRIWPRDKPVNVGRSELQALLGSPVSQYGIQQCYQGEIPILLIRPNNPLLEVL